MNIYKKINLIVWSLILLFAFSNVVSPQQSKQHSGLQPIIFNVTVGTEKGFLTGLTAENFSIYDNGKLQPISVFDNKEMPLSVGVLLDVSNPRSSIVNPKIVNAAILNGLKRFIELSNSSNEYFFMTFNKGHKLLLDYTQDSNVVLNTIEEASKTETEGSSNVYDAVEVGLEKLSNGKHSKRIIIIITDGIDLNSKIKFDDLRERLKTSDIMLYGLGIYKGSDELRTSRMVKNGFDELAKQTGGYFHFGHWTPMTKGSNDREVRAVFAMIANELRNQYVVGYKINETTNNQNNKFWHNIEIKIKVPANTKGIEDIFLKTRKGYYSSIK